MDSVGESYGELPLKEFHAKRTRTYRHTISCASEPVLVYIKNRRIVFDYDNSSNSIKLTTVRFTEYVKGTSTVFSEYSEELLQRFEEVSAHVVLVGSITFLRLREREPSPDRIIDVKHIETTDP